LNTGNKLLAAIADFYFSISVNMHVNKWENGSSFQISTQQDGRLAWCLVNSNRTQLFLKFIRWMAK